MADPLPPLATFGTRIMICGPSNTGKSTLATALGRALDLPVVHLDQLRFRPGTDWQRRPDAEFSALHEEAATADRWIFEGNYSDLMPSRLARATGIMLLNDNRWANFARYVRRTLFQRRRAGALPGNRDSIKWDMILWILMREPRNVRRYRRTLPAAGLPFLELRSMRELRRAYGAWGLERQRPLPLPSRGPA